MLEAVDEGLNSLGETVKATLLMLIRERFKIERNEIPYKPREFSIALRSILGNYGGKFIENLIIRCLYAKLGLGQPSSDKEFHEHILEARRKISIIRDCGNPNCRSSRCLGDRNPNPSPKSRRHDAPVGRGVAGRLPTPIAELAPEWEVGAPQVAFSGPIYRYFAGRLNELGVEDL